MKKSKQKYNIVIILIQFILLIITFIWGYNNYLKIRVLININEDLMRIIREKTNVKFSTTFQKGNYISELTIRTIENQNILLSKYVHSLLIFIDTSCNACLKVLRDIYKKVENYQNRGLIIIVIGMGSKETLKEFSDRLKLPIHYAQDPFAKLHRKFGIKGSLSWVYIKNGIIKIIADPFSYEKRVPQLIDFLKDYKLN